jgi:hypothetical protein
MTMGRHSAPTLTRRIMNRLTRRDTTPTPNTVTGHTTVTTGTPDTDTTAHTITDPTRPPEAGE